MFVAHDQMTRFANEERREENQLKDKMELNTRLKHGTLARAIVH